MKKFNSILIMFTIFSILISIHIGKTTKDSFINVDFNEILTSENRKEFFMDNSVEIEENSVSLNMLYEKSDAILKVKPIPNSEKIVLGQTLTKCKVLDVAKGNSNLNEIYVYEDMYIHTSWNGYPNPPQKISYSVVSYDGYNLMDPNKEYILFLTETENPIIKDNTPMYRMSHSVYSKYLVDKKYNYKIIEPSNDINYNDFKAYDVYFNSERIKQNYDNIHKELLNLTK